MVVSETITHPHPSTPCPLVSKMEFPTKAMRMMIDLVKAMEEDPQYHSTNPKDMTILRIERIDLKEAKLVDHCWIILRAAHWETNPGGIISLRINLDNISCVTTWVKNTIYGKYGEWVPGPSQKTGFEWMSTPYYYNEEEVLCPVVYHDPRLRKLEPVVGQMTKSATHQ